MIFFSSHLGNSHLHFCFFFFQAEDGIRDLTVTGVQTCALPIFSTTRAELQAKPKDTRPQITPPGTFPLPPQPGVPQTPTSEENRYGNIDLMAAAVWVVQHIHDQVKDHALEVAAIATGGAHLSTFKDRSIEKAIDEIGGELHSQYNISYTPAGTDTPGYHEIKVNIVRNDAKGLRVRARPGYYLAAPES